MGTATSRNQGFTLVEILIVVVILGILAAIVIPQFTSASESAKAGSVMTQLQTIRSQLSLYQIQHQGVYPTLAELQAGWGVMLEKTDADGTINAAGKFGPYLQKEPVNPFTSSSLLAAGTSEADGAATDGWAYDEDDGGTGTAGDTGNIWAVGFDEATETFTKP
ncbi:MAG: prepilin-type N-terminal cleavage/methylation domain-containing protein [Phycisphaerae bacterium]|nr:prepilin-type N-terminal cleavage/methylation domain-containing protein [Phycisphaerae bacterium]